MRATVLPGRLGRSILLVLPTLVLLAACGGDDGGGDVTPPAPDPTVSVTPSTVAMIVGDTASVSATAANTTATPTFTSSAPAVVSVDAGGKLTAVGEGTATITATAATATATATVTVTAPEPTLSIVSMTQGGQAVDPDDVSGTIDVEVEFADLPNTFQGTIELVIGEAVIGSTDFSAAAAAAAGPSMTGEGAGGAGSIGGRRTLEGNTNAVALIDNDMLEAEVVNGVTELLARVPGVVTSPGQQINVNNESVISLRGLGSTRTLVLVDGKRYHAGAVTAEFSRVGRDGLDVDLLTVELVGTGTQSVDPIRIDAVREGATPIYKAELSDILFPPQGTAGLETGVSFTTGTVTLSDQSQTTEQILGGLFEGAPDATWNVDQVAGTRVKDYDLSLTWHGKGLTADAFSARIGMALGGDDPSHVDNGVGGLTAQVYWGVTENLRVPFVNTNDIDDTSGTDYGAWVKFTDGLQNERWEVVADALAQPYRWGKDGVAPSVTRAEGAGFLPRRSFNATADLSAGWTGTDLESGMSDRVWGRLTYYGADTGEEGEVLVGDDSETGMVQLDASLALDIASSKWDAWSLSAQVGYLNAELAVEDEAGNLSNTLRWRGAFDTNAPMIMNFSAPATYTGGALATFGADITDDVEVNDIEWSFDYGLDWRVGTRIRLGARFDGEFTPSTSATSEQYVYSSLEKVNQIGEPAGTVSPLVSAGLYVWDAGQNEAEVDVDIDESEISGVNLSGAFGLADRLYIRGDFSVDVNVDGSENPESTGDFEIETWTPNIDNYHWTRVRMALKGKSLVDGANILLPIEQELQRTDQDNGGWYQIFYNGEIDFGQLAVPKGLKIDGIVAIASDDDGNAAVSEAQTFQINYIFQF